MARFRGRVYLFRDHSCNTSHTREPKIIAVDGDVLRYISLLQDVDFVMKGGTVYQMEGIPVEEALN